MNGSRPFQDKPALRVEGLSLARGGRVLFEPLSFTAGPGEYVEIRGANGAGKTSLLRALAGFLKPRAGRISIDRVEEPATALHYVGHLNGLKSAASVRSHLQYWGALLGVPPDEIQTNLVLGVLALQHAADAPARTLSQGQARRLALARLLLSPRPIWLLDEPAAALDAQGRDILAGMLEAHRVNGDIVLAAVHEPLGRAPSQTLTVCA